MPPKSSPESKKRSLFEPDGSPSSPAKRQKPLPEKTEVQSSPVQESSIPLFITPPKKPAHKRPRVKILKSLRIQSRQDFADAVRGATTHLSQLFPSSQGSSSSQLNFSLTPSLAPTPPSMDSQTTSQHHFSAASIVSRIAAACTRLDGFPDLKIGAKFDISVEEVEWLCSRSLPLFQSEPTVLHINAPVKIFGDIHGQLHDLMLYFALHGSPDSDRTFNYLFLGDYVDRGLCSIHVLCLLLALKIMHPTRVFMLRGNHELRRINVVFGFANECKERFGSRKGKEIYVMFNDLFDFLPLGALIGKAVFCIHGGISESFTRIEQLEAVERPLRTDEDEWVASAALWCDPSTDKTLSGYEPNPRGTDTYPRICQFGTDAVKKFCSENEIDIIIRAHEYPMTGVELYASGRLITLFSATNYCGITDNCGAMLEVSPDLQIKPHIILPGKLEAYEYGGKGTKEAGNVSPARGKPTASERSRVTKEHDAEEEQGDG